jgi:predicted Zn finger-like uncharacterized protein
MILTCPSCETRYQVDEAAIDRSAGRQVRCANCGYLWHFAPALEEHSPAQPVRAAGPALAPAVADGVLETDAASAVSSPLDLGSAAAPAIGRMGPGLRGLLQLAAVLAVAAIVIVPILARNSVVETWPEATKVYDAVGIKTVASGTGLGIAVTLLRGQGSFTVTGEITNTTGRALSVPPLRVMLRDTTLREVQSQLVDPPVETLAPGAVARFKAVFDHPDITTTDAVARFETD